MFLNTLSSNRSSLPKTILTLLGKTNILNKKYRSRTSIWHHHHHHPTTRAKFCAKKKRLISDIIISKRHLRSQQAQHDYRYRNSPSPQNKEKQRCFLPDRESTACHATHSHTCFLGKPSSWLHWQAKPNQLTRKCPPSHGQYFCLFFFM